MKRFFVYAFIVFLVSFRVLANSPESVVKEYTDAISSLDKEKSYSLISDNDKPYLSLEKHNLLFCDNFEPDICDILLSKTKYRIKSTVSDGLVAKSRITRTFPDYTKITKLLSMEKFSSLLKASDNERFKIKGELKQALIEKLNNNDFPLRTEELYLRSLNENGVWKIYYEYIVPKSVVTRRIKAEEDGKNTVAAFFDFMKKEDFKSAYNLFTEKDRAKYSYDDFIEKFELDDDEVIYGFKNSKIECLSSYGSTQDYHRWRFEYKIIKPNPENHNGTITEKLKFVTILSAKDGKTEILMNSIK